MVIADFIALCVVLGLLGLGGKTIISSFQRLDENAKARQAEDNKMRDDLRKALESHNKQRLEDFMVLWGDRMQPAVKEHVKQRIDQLFIEENP